MAPGCSIILMKESRGLLLSKAKKVKIKFSFFCKKYETIFVINNEFLDIVWKFIFQTNEFLLLFVEIEQPTFFLHSK